MSNTLTRVLFAAATIPAVLALAFLGGYFWFVFVAVVMIFCMLEFRALAAKKGGSLQIWAMLSGGLLFLTVFMHGRVMRSIGELFGGNIAIPLPWHLFIITALLFCIAVCAVELFRNVPSPILNVAMTLFGMFYFGLFLGAVLGIREVFSIAEFPVGPVFHTAELNVEQLKQLHQWGGFTMMSVLVTIWMCDTAAYFGGRAMGKHKLFPRVSPNKTWEGSVWGFVAAIGTMIAAKYLLLDYLSVGHACVMGALIGSVGQIGDLVESLFKRDADVKDSSTLLPGHGGVYDRFDSLLFTAPVLYLYLDFIVFA